MSSHNSTTSPFPDSTVTPATLVELSAAMERYATIHGPLALTVCIVGVIMNIINIMVLSYKDMISPVNRLLQAIALADLLTMLTYIPYSLLFYIIHGVEDAPIRNNYASTSYLKFHGLSSMISHTASIWLTVTVALFRYIFLSAANGRMLCSLKNAYIAIVVVFALSIVINLPQLFILKINDYSDTDSGLSWFYLDTNGLPQYNKAITTTQYILTAFLAKIIPSLILIVLSALLIRFLMRAQSRYRQIRQSCTSKDGSIHATSNDRKRQEQTNQTTKLLVAVAIVFTLSELPQGILFGLISLGVYFERLFWLLGNLFDLITMTSCAINFVLYCIMSSQFRKIFILMLRIKYLKSLWLCTLMCTKPSPSSPQTSMPTEHTYAPKRSSTSNSISLEEVAEKLVVAVDV